MKTTLVSIPTETLGLEGAWHEPEGRAVGAVLLLHGNTMNFFTGAPRFLPPALTRMGLACLAFNRRGHDILGIRDSRAAEGAAFQTYAEAIDDNRIAARWLEARGFPQPVVIGHSNGGTLAVQHVAEHPRTPALVLLSAHCGGREMVPRASQAGLLAQDRLAEITAKARQLVSTGRGREAAMRLMTEPATSTSAICRRSGARVDSAQRASSASSCEPRVVAFRSRVSVLMTTPPRGRAAPAPGSDGGGFP